MTRPALRLRNPRATRHALCDLADRHREYAGVLLELVDLIDRTDAGAPSRDKPNLIRLLRYNRGDDR